MVEKNTRLKVRTGWLTAVAPWLLWLLVMVLPLILGKELLENALEVDKKLWLISTRQMLMNEAQNYKSALNPENILARAFDSASVAHLYRKKHQLSAGELKVSEAEAAEIGANLRNHEVVRQLPWGSTNVKQDSERFVEFMGNRVGARPSVMYCLAEDVPARFFMTEPHFSLPVTPKEFDECLKKAFSLWHLSFKSGTKADRFLKFYFSIPEIQQWLGLFYPVDIELFGLRERFSNLVNDTIYLVNFHFTDAKGKDMALYLVYERFRLDWRHALKRIFKTENEGEVKHSFGYSKLTSLPRMIETEDSIDFIFEFPSEFKKIYLARNAENHGKTPVLRLSMPIRNNHSRIINNTNLRFFCRALLLFSLLLPVAITLKRFSNHGSLKMLLAVSFSIGAMVPVSGLAWLTVSFVNSQKYFEAEKVFAEMNRQMQEMEKKIELQRTRNEVYFSLLAHRVGQLSLQQRRQLPKILSWFSNAKGDEDEEVTRPLVGYFMLNHDGFEHLEIKDRFLANMLQIKPFFSGVYNEFMLEMGFYSGISPAQRREIEQRAQVALGVTEHLADRQMFNEILEFEGTRVKSTMTPNQEYFSAFWLDRRQVERGSLFIVYSDNGDWLWQINQILRMNVIPINRKFNDYKIIMGFFRLDKLNLSTIDQLKYGPRIMTNADWEFLNRLGRALFTNSGYHAINNLADNPANLILARIIGDQNLFAVAYAEKQSGYEGVKIALLALLMVLLAVVSSAFLASGTAKVLLMSLPAFVEAIRQVQHENYHWQIEINSGDEFEVLGQSFNLMGRKLLEREKLSQLVSENVMEAIAGGDAGMLRPGGEKRHAAIMFSDIRDFTSLSEKYPAEEIVEMLNSYFTEMAAVISQNGGIIDKLIGDAIQAVFYRREDAVAAEIRACAAAVAMKQSLKNYNHNRRRSGKFEVNNGIGIASGEVITGRVGSETGKLDATVLGQKLKLAEALETKSKYALKSSILIDAQTAQVLLDNGIAAELLPFRPDRESEKVFELVRLN